MGNNDISFGGILFCSFLTVLFASLFGIEAFLIALSFFLLALFGGIAAYHVERERKKNNKK